MTTGRIPSADEMLLGVLSRYMAPILARSVLNRAMGKAGTSSNRATNADLARIVPLLEDGARLFVDPAHYAHLRRELVSLLGAQVVEVEQRHIRVRTERDVGTSRAAAREVAERMGARPAIAQRVATAVSELAQNVVSHTPGGEIEIIPVESPIRAIVVRATDQGTGIRNLDEVLAGQARGTSSPGIGIAGTRRLADRFTIESGANGTRIEVEFQL